MKHSKISSFMMLKDGEITFGTIIKLVAVLSIVTVVYTAGYITGNFNELEYQKKSKYVHLVCMEKQDYIKCREHLYKIFTKSSRF